MHRFAIQVSPVRVKVFKSSLDETEKPQTHPKKLEGSDPESSFAIWGFQDSQRFRSKNNNSPIFPNVCGRPLASHSPPEGHRASAEADLGTENMCTACCSPENLKPPPQATGACSPLSISPALGACYPPSPSPWGSSGGGDCHSPP